MGTRADFYTGEGKNAVWLGSIAWDGYPRGIPDEIRIADTEAKYVKAVQAFLSTREDATEPEDGWPWPWNDSQTTDYAYTFRNSKVMASNYGRKWFNATEDNSSGDAHRNVIFPDMSSRKNVQMGKKSGLIVIRSK